METTTQDPLKCVTLKDIKDRTGFSVRTLYKLMAKNAFPPPLPVRIRKQLAWHEKTIVEWLENQ